MTGLLVNPVAISSLKRLLNPKSNDVRNLLVSDKGAKL